MVIRALFLLLIIISMIGSTVTPNKKPLIFRGLLF